MSSFLDGQMAKAIAAGFNGKLLSGTLRKIVTSGLDGHGDPITTTTDYPTQGTIDSYSALIKAQAGIPSTDVKILLIAGLTGAEPLIADRVQLRGQWFQIRNVSPDPALATYECQSFGVQS